MAVLGRCSGDTTSMLTEAHIADQLGVRDVRPWNVSTEPRRAAIRSGQLGQYVLDTHPQYFEKALAPSLWVNSYTNDYINTVYGGNMVDAKTGKVRSFDLGASYGRTPTPIQFDDQARRHWAANDYVDNRARYPGEDMRSQLGQTMKFGESQFASDTAHILKGLGAFGLLLAASDVIHGFEDSPGTGVRRIAKVGVDWGGYSAAGAAANAVLRMGDVAMRFPRIGTVAVVVSGFAGAYLADRVRARYLDDEKHIE